MKQAVAEAEQNLRNQLEKEHQYAIELESKETVTAHKLNEQKISYLEAKIKEQDQLSKHQPKG